MDRSELVELAKSILDKGYLMSLGVTDESGVWVCDVIYVHDDAMNVYWVSDPEVRHSQAIHKNGQVAATITVSNNPGEDNVGIQLQGIAEKLDGEIHKLAVKHRLKRKKPAPAEGEEFLEDGESWYKLTPKKIDIIFEPKFGFDKQIVEL